MAGGDVNVWPERPVAFESGAFTLRGILGSPVTGEVKGAVVLVHGWTGYRIGPRRILVHAARRLVEEGYYALRFDLRGRGDSEGEGPITSLDNMIEDTLSAVGFVREETGLDRVVLLGICSGSNVAIGAATVDEGIRELILWSVLPFQPEQRATLRLRRARHYIGTYIRKALRPDTWLRLLRGDVDVRGVARTIAGEPTDETNLKDSSRDIMAEFSGFGGRALFITGTRDPEGMEGKKVFERLCRRNRIQAEFHLVREANHSFYSPSHEREVIELSVSWLRQGDGR